MWPLLFLLGRCPATGKEGGSCLSRKLADPDPGQSTVKGCTCTSQCSASITDAFDCDWCYTAGSCGQFGLEGHWDYCVYPSDPAYDAQTAEQKMDALWQQVVADPQFGSYPSVTGIVDESIQTSFDDWTDDLPAGRKKYIHSVGAICKFKLDITASSPYTGLFEAGAKAGLIRMGSAADLSNGGLTPGLGFKFLRSGVHSGDFVALHSLDLGQSWNFFKYNLSNHIAPPAGFTAILAKKFNQASQCAPQVGLSDMAKWSQDGTPHQDVNFPFKLFLVPSAAVQLPETPKVLDELMGLMEAFPIGTTLFTMYACGEPAGSAEMKPTDGGLAKACARPLKLGDIVTTSKCTPSAFGDAKLFIRHQRVEEDWKLKPDWLNQYDAKAACGSSTASPDGAPATCAAKHGGPIMSPPPPEPPMPGTDTSHQPSWHWMKGWGWSWSSDLGWHWSWHLGGWY
eukprot:CAMPEP_0184377666 /NCGR_PEP_ID=MMETSP0007-20130409/2454_1 /TAXON_ID=97485 /ORGANISM="Prymnesium parvum, Strain Texoma1" /LENGTH=453 /DNA_ID=CAMNT_0026721659 /DNA_START=19 /DNA_END=1380 /DNA_ORIENTATION=+